MSKIIEKIKYYCHKILPLSYDDSLSYYEVLCKLQQEIIDLSEDIETGLIDYIKEVLPLCAINR